MSLITLQDFLKQCRKQDFLYMFLDEEDHKGFKKGAVKQEALQKIVQEGGEDYLAIMIQVIVEQVRHNDLRDHIRRDREYAGGVGF